MARQQNLTDEWLEAERGARAFTVAGGWGSADGVVVSPPRDAGWMARSRGGTRDTHGTHGAAVPVVLLAPQWPGLEDSVAVALADDAVAVGLLRGGVRVARLRALNFAGPPDVGMWVDAIVDSLQSIASGSGAVGLAGTWVAGTACALAAARHEELLLLVCAGAPSAEIMSRRTPENEDDSMWTSSATLQLIEQLADLAPLEAVGVFPRPSFFVQGAVDELLTAAHFEAWRAAITATGRSADGVEIGFTDAFFRCVDAGGAIDVHGEEGRSLLADAVAGWLARTVTPAAEARRVR
jgi:hypothetical protein